MFRSATSYNLRRALSSLTWRAFVCAVITALLAVSLAAQSSTGVISGTVTDPSGAVVHNAEITVKNKATGVVRVSKTESDGNFSVPALPAGEYEVTAKFTGFRTYLTEVTINVGTVSSLDIKMEIGQANEIVTVEATAAAVNTEQHSIEGIITRQKIQDLPLNGRSFLNLAFLEPGVTVSPGTTSQYNSLFNVSILGGGSDKTAITVDGGIVRNPIEGGTGMNFSQEIVQEFQVSSNNFDLSTGITSTGSVNVVSRTGGNQFHGAGYFFFRDHNMAAYPGLGRNPLNPDPFFVRRNPGVWVSGPVRKDRLFFWANYEYTNQTQVFTVQPDLPSIAGLAGNFLSPYRGHLVSARLDLKLTDKHNLFLRASHDQNKGFGPNGGPVLPSNWLQNKNEADQGVLGITSTLTPTLTNDFRFNFTYWQNRNLFADQNVCPNCLGLGLAEISLQGSSNFRVGNTQNATQGRDLRRFDFLDTVTWVKQSHRFRFGGEFEYAPGTGFWGYCDPGCAQLFSPEAVKSLVPAALLPALFPKLPSVIRTTDDLLNLPFAGAVIGIGNPAQPPPYNIDKAKQNNRLRFFGQDTWKIKPQFTLNYGLAWNFESTLVNRDLSKPAYLAPLYGSDLSPTENNYNNFSPSLGFAWAFGKESKTVLRAGAGLYWDTEQLYRRLQERAFVGPLGNGRIQFPSTGFVNIFPGIVDLGAGGRSVPVGASIPQSLTNLTYGQFQQIYNSQIAAVTASVAGRYTGDLALRTIQISKSAAQLYPHDYPVQRSYQMSAGLQHQFSSDMVLSVDFVRRVFVNTLLGEIDLNRYNRFINGVRSPIIPACTSAAQQNDPNAQCSTGSISFWIPGGRSTYTAMLAKLDKRFSKRLQFTVAYALTDQRGINGIDNLDNYFQTYGPQGSKHILNISGTYNLPWGFQIGVISAYQSRGAVTVRVNGVDLDGDGTTNAPLPTLGYNCLNRGCGKDNLASAVQLWNARYPAGSVDARCPYPVGDARRSQCTVIPQLSLPANYELGDDFKSQDVRLTKNFTVRERVELKVFGEVFNIFNIANLSGYNFTINSGSFGQPTQRTSQVFGSGGPRAFQLGARLSF